MIYRLRVTKADFSNYQLLPVAGTGLKIQMSGISINAGGKLNYKYKRGFIKISDTMGFNAEISDMQADLTLAIGKETSFMLNVYRMYRINSSRSERLINITESNM